MDVISRLDDVLPLAAADADATDRDGQFPQRTVTALGESGLLGLTLSPEGGGLGAGPVEFVDVTSRLAAVCGSSAMVYLMHVAAAQVVAAAPPPGDPEATARLASGEWLGTLAFSEKGSRSHFWAPVSGLDEANGGLRLVAEKSWVTAANRADVVVASVRSVDAAGPMDCELYLVGGDDDGYVVTGGFDGLGLRGNDSAPVEMSIVVDERDRLGDASSGFGLMMQVVLPWFALGNAAVSIGLARAALNAAIAHVSEARFAHLDSSIADLPTVRAYIAKAWTALAAHEALMRSTAQRMAAPDDGTILAVLATKAGCNEMALSVTETALRVAGGAAFSRHVGIDRPYRDARAGFVMAPTSDALYEFAGRALCGMELF